MNSLPGYPPRAEWQRPLLAPYSLSFACGHTRNIEPMDYATDEQVEQRQAEAEGKSCSMRCATPAEPKPRTARVATSTTATCIVCQGPATMSASLGAACLDHYDDLSG